RLMTKAGSKHLAGKTLFVTGASRGIGLAIALRAARDGANIAIAAKTAEPHKHLPGTIFTAAKEIEAAGGKALPLVVDVRDEASVVQAVEATVQAFGGIDICVNNASAIQLTGTLATEMKRYDLMHQINTRGTFLTSKACIPHLQKAANPHVLMMSPPLDMSARWFKNHVAYTMAKFGMSLCVLGMAEEFKEEGIAFNALWPRTIIATARRLRVFVSCTLVELAEERAAVARAISALRLTPVLFELGARPHPPRELYRAYLAQSDIFIGLYWQRYGWIGPGMDISGLEDEFRLSRSLPRLLYVKSPAPVREVRLTAMIDQLQAEGTASYRSFRTPRELGRLVRDDLALLLSERFASRDGGAGR